MKKNKLARVSAIISLIIIFIFIVVIIYSLLTQNGRLALAFIIGLIFISILMLLAISGYKKISSIKK